MEESIQQQYLNRVLKPGLTKADIEKIVLDFLPVGRIVGKLGDWYIRWYKENPIVYKLPKGEDYRISQTKDSISNRAGMAAATRIAAALNNIDILKTVWNKADIEGNCAYRKMLRYNKKQLVKNYPSDKISLTPGKSHFHADITVSLNESNIKIEQSSIFRENDSLVVVLFAYDPLNKCKNSFEIIKLWDSSPVYEINLTEEQKEICSRYKKYLLCSAVIRNNGAYITWSNTIVMNDFFEHYRESFSSELSYLFIIYSTLRKYKLSNSGISFNIHSPPG